MNAITNMARLTRAGAIIAWSGARVLPDEVRLPPPLRLFRRMTAPLRQDKANGTADASDARLSTALTTLGPSYIKLGLAGELAGWLGAPVLRMEQLRADHLSHAVRSIA